MRFLAVLVATTALLGAPAATADAPPLEPPGSTVPTGTANPFLPENENVTDCLSALPQPDCGSEERGGLGQWLTFGVMILGLTFVGWRVARGVRRRERAMSPKA